MSFLFNKSRKKQMSKKELSRYNGKDIDYAVERLDDGSELVIGKNGGIAVLDDCIVVLCEAHEVFRCSLGGAVIAELMSGNGADIVGYDAQSGKKRHIVAHYSYYR